VAEHWVLNASPLIVLARVGLEGLPLSLAEQVVVPRQVVEEIQAGPTLDPARRAFAADRSSATAALVLRGDQRR
jgi:hypothetical protein